MPRAQRLLTFLKHQCVTVVAAIATALSFLLTPAEGWWQAIDWRTLCLLFCLMFVVAGFRSCSLFRVTAQALLNGRTRYRAVAHILVQLTFLLSMVITNDVALIALVPFAIYVLNCIGLRHRLIGLIVLQTVAANLGSMATPIGNPQNLFLYTAYAIPTLDFFATMVPITLAGGVLLALLTHCLRDEPINVQFTHRLTLSHPRKVALYSVLFLLCLLTVFRLFPDALLFALVLASGLLLCRNILKAVDYGLLLTFICFFLFSHNLGGHTALREALTQLLTHHTQTTAIIASQFLSNVPAAILLAPFTNDWASLLLGVNIGGFGTPIASLASLISMGFYLKEPEAQPGRYLGAFLLLNAILLAALVYLTTL